MAEPLRQGDLLELYTTAVGEYQFQVNLNASRVQYYLVLNAALASAGLGLIDVRSGPRLALSLFIFGVGAVVAAESRRANRTGHAYYTSIRARIRLLEEALGTGQFSLRTTQGMRRVDPDPGEPPRRGRKGTITRFNDNLFRTFYWVNIVLALTAATFLGRHLWPDAPAFARASASVTHDVHATPILEVKPRASSLEVEVVYLGGRGGCGALQQIATHVDRATTTLTAYIGSRDGSRCSSALTQRRTLVRLEQPLQTTRVVDGSTGKTVPIQLP